MTRSPGTEPPRPLARSRGSEEPAASSLDCPALPLAALLCSLALLTARGGEPTEPTVSVAAEPGGYSQLKLVAADPGEGDQFGGSVATDGETLLAGAPFDDGAGHDAGAVYVFASDGDGGWTQAAELWASDPTSGARFGTSAAVEGDRFVAGAMFADLRTGAAYVFEKDPQGAWSEVARLVALDREAGDAFGVAVSLSGDRIAVGAVFDDGEAGSAYLFERDDLGSWNQVAKLTPSDPPSDRWFGHGLALEGDTLVVGAPFDDEAESDAGAAYVFDRDDSGRWLEVAKLTAADGGFIDHLGGAGAVGISGDRIVLGAPEDDDEAGSAYVFERDESGNWLQAAKLVAADREACDELGESAAISGDRVAAGADDDNDDLLGEDSGSVYIFERDELGNWSEVAKLNAADGMAGDRLGNSIAIHGETIVAGAPRADVGASNAGAAYVFDPTVGGSASGVVTSSAVCRNHRSGQTVAIPLGGAASWDCEAAGLGVSAGDRVTQQVNGNAAGAPIGGGVTGVTLDRVVCSNETTGQRVTFPADGAAAWDCTAAGLLAGDGDWILQVARGTSE